MESGEGCISYCCNGSRGFTCHQFFLKSNEGGLVQIIIILYCQVLLASAVNTVLVVFIKLHRFFHYDYCSNQKFPGLHLLFYLLLMYF